MNAASSLDQLPDRLGPVGAKELRQGLRRTSFVVPFLAVQVLAAAATWFEFQTGATGYGDGGWFMNLHMLFTAGPFWLVSAVVCMILMPLAGLHLVIWGLCALTLISLLPYIVLRYFVGGVEFMREAACAATVLGGAAVVAAGAIGASGFRSPAARIGVLTVFLVSTLLSGGALTGAGMAVGDFMGRIILHINAAVFVMCMTILGLGIARSRLRTDHMPYEARQSTVLLITLVALPFLTILAALMTCGFFGMAAHLFAILAALRRDRPYAYGSGKFPP